MAECVASPSFMKLRMQHSDDKKKGFTSYSTRFKLVQRKYSNRSWMYVRLPEEKTCELSASKRLNLILSPCSSKNSLKCTCLGSLLSPEGAAYSDWIPIVDQVLLMTSIVLTYTAGVIPVKKSDLNGIFNDNAIPESSKSSGSVSTNHDPTNTKHALDIVKGKLMDSLGALEYGTEFGKSNTECNEYLGRQPLSLNAVADAPRLRLLWASFQQIEQAVNEISESKTLNMANRLTVFSDVIQKSCQPVCITWLERELSIVKSNSNVALAEMLLAKLNKDDTVLLNIRKSGKEDLYAYLFCFLCSGSMSDGCSYDHSLFVSNGVSILEDLVITLADGIASIYLELISVDSNLSSEMNSLSLSLCVLSTRSLQRLRNEIALKQWLYQNMESVVSMYEDRFDLWTLQSHPTAEPSKRHTENSWWKRFIHKKTQAMSSALYFVVIGPYLLPVKRTKELRALTGWRYYFSLFLEFSDISMPLIASVVDKVRNAISFLLVCLIGRSVGLIYTGIRESLRWK